MKKKELKSLLKQQQKKIVELNEQINSINTVEQQKKEIILHKEVIQKKLKQIECVEESFERLQKENIEFNKINENLNQKIKELQQEKNIKTLSEIKE